MTLTGSLALVHWTRHKKDEETMTKKPVRKRKAPDEVLVHNDIGKVTNMAAFRKAGPGAKLTMWMQQPGETLVPCKCSLLPGKHYKSNVQAYLPAEEI